MTDLIAKLEKRLEFDEAHVARSPDVIIDKHRLEAAQHEAARRKPIDEALVDCVRSAADVVEYYNMHSSTSRESHELIAALEQLRKVVEGE